MLQWRVSVCWGGLSRHNLHESDGTTLAATLQWRGRVAMDVVLATGGVVVGASPTARRRSSARSDSEVASLPRLLVWEAVTP